MQYDTGYAPTQAAWSKRYRQSWPQKHASDATVATYLRPTGLDEKRGKDLTQHLNTHAHLDPADIRAQR